VLDRYPEKIRYLKQENAGVAAARNTAVMAANAPFIFTLDPDDWLQEDCLEFQVRCLREHPEVDANYLNPVFRGGASNGSTWMDVYPSTGEVSFWSVAAGKTPPANPGSIIRRDALLRAGLYDTTLRSWEDFGMWLGILQSGGRITYSKAPLVNYRVREGSLKRKLRYMEDAVKVLDNIEATMPLTPQEHEALENRRRPAQLELERLRGKACVNRREWSAAKQHFEYCLRHAPTMKLRLVVLCLSLCPWLLVLFRASTATAPSR